MTIEVLDWAMYLILVLTIWKCLPKQYKEEMGMLMGITIELVFTVIYCIIFYHYSWADDVFIAIGHDIHFHFKW